MAWYWREQDIHQTMNSQKTPHSSPSPVSYGVYFVSIWDKNICVIKRLDYTTWVAGKLELQRLSVKSVEPRSSAPILSSYRLFTHWGCHKMADILHKTFSTTFFLMKWDLTIIAANTLVQNWWAVTMRPRKIEITLKLKMLPAKCQPFCSGLDVLAKLCCAIPASAQSALCVVSAMVRCNLQCGLFLA